MLRSKKTEIQEKEPNKKNNNKFINAVGRRKESVARIRLYSSSSAEFKKGLPAGRQGDIIVNGKKIEEYFPSKIQQVRYLEPLHAANAVGKYAFTIKVSGGGINSQLDALVLGISRALSILDRQKYRSVLRKKGFLTRDARIRERRKVGMGGKSRRKRQSPKR
jgi:small subunit ribosomal protein S9